jgi:Holliday junction DNA helicase RuvA
MIVTLQGKLTQKGPAYVVLETGGVGYGVHISLHTWDQIQHLETCRLYTHLHVKEDAHTLYGFYRPDERALFLALIGVSGIGPNTARMVLSAMSPADFRQAVLTENEAAIKRIKGIGPKSAKRLILELKDRLAADGPSAEGLSPAAHNSARDEALSALVMLGFARPASEKALSKVLDGEVDDPTVETLIKLALQNL